MRYALFVIRHAWIPLVKMRKSSRASSTDTIWLETSIFMYVGVSGSLLRMKPCKLWTFGWPVRWKIHIETGWCFGLWMGWRETCLCGSDCGFSSRGFEQSGFYSWIGYFESRPMKSNRKRVNMHWKSTRVYSFRVWYMWFPFSWDSGATQQSTTSYGQ